MKYSTKSIDVYRGELLEKLSDSLLSDAPDIADGAFYIYPRLNAVHAKPVSGEDTVFWGYGTVHIMFRPDGTQKEEDYILLGIGSIGQMSGDLDFEMEALRKDPAKLEAERPAVLGFADALEELSARLRDWMDDDRSADERAAIWENS